jgi:hypothetical protein
VASSDFEGRASVTARAEEEDVMADINPIHLQKALKGASYPATKDSLVATAKDNGADDEVMSFLNDLPDREFGGPNGVTKEISSDS